MRWIGRGNVYLYDEVYESRRVPSWWKEIIAAKSDGQRFRQTYGCPKFFQTERDGRTIADEYRKDGEKETRLSIQPAPVHISERIARVMEFLKVDKDRTHPITEQKGSPRLFFFKNRCVNTIQEIQEYAWQDVDDPKDEQKEEPEKRNNHAMEAMEPAKASAAALRASPAERRSEAADFFIDLMDGDDDGQLGQDEFVRVVKEIFGRDMAEKLFAGMDKDRDGRLSKEEIEADLEKGEGVFAEVFRKLFDGNGDGRVTQGEFRLMTAGRVDDTRATRFFNGMDRTGDGALTPREMRWGFGPMREDGGATSPFLLDRLKLDRRV